MMDAAKARLGLTMDKQLASHLGVGRSFLCLVKNGSKNMPDTMRAMLDSILKDKNDGKNHALREVPEVRTAVHGRGRVLPSALPVDPPAAASGAAAQPDQDSGRKQAGAGAADPDPAGTDATGEVPAAKRPRLKRGTRAAVILKEGEVYYPDLSNRTLRGNAHTHRRIVGLVRHQDRKTVVVYSFGGDHNSICNRDTFVQWLDPTRTA